MLWLTLVLPAPSSRIGGDLIGKDGDQDEEQDHDGAQQRERVAHDHAQHVAKGAGALDLRLDGKDRYGSHIISG